MVPELRAEIERITGTRVRASRPLGGGDVAEVALVELADGARLVAKQDGGTGSLETEAWMLRYLAAKSRLPVPAVIHAAPRLLLMEYIEAGDPLDARAQAHAALLLADLHGIAGAAFGLERDTLIGGLKQPNGEASSWIAFFRERRLLHMAGEARRAGRLPGALMARIEGLAGRLDELLDEPSAPGLIHGDMWGGNILCRGGRVAAFVDPAIYYADPEIELAFSTLFSTFGEPFFARYRELRPVRPGFFEARRDLYNLYPLLVHVRLFGGGYVDAVARTLARFGC